MDFDIKRLLNLVKSAPRALRVMAIIVAIDMVVILYALLSLEDDVDARTDQINELKGKLTAQETKVQSTRKEIDRLPELRKLYDKAIADGVLADQDRLKFINLAQDLGKEHRLSDFHFKLAPEVSSPLAGSKFQIVSTDVSLTDGALLDGDVIAFWDDVLQQSQAHYRITKAVIERLPNKVDEALQIIRTSAPSTMLSALSKSTLLHAELEFEWQSMRQPSEVAGTSEVSGPKDITKRPAAAVLPQDKGP